MSGYSNYIQIRLKDLFRIETFLALVLLPVYFTWTGSFGRLAAMMLTESRSNIGSGFAFFTGVL